MKTSLAATLFAVASIPLMGQMPSTPAPEQPGNPPMQQSTPPGEARPGAGPSTPASQPEAPAAMSAPGSTSGRSSVAATSAADMRPVDSKLVSKIDSKTAKTGDDVVLQTESSVKTADGTELPKGTKVMGHILAVHPSGGQTSQVVLVFDHAELKDGKSLPIHSEIEAVGGTADMAANVPDAPTVGAASTTSTGGSNANSNSASNPSSNSTDQSSGGSGAVASAPAGPAGAASAGKHTAAGTIVSRNGNIAIRTTSVPGVMLATNAPGEHDPRLAQASGLLLGASKDVELDSGTRFVLAVSPSTAAAPQTPQK